MEDIGDTLGLAVGTKSFALCCVRPAVSHSQFVFSSINESQETSSHVDCGRSYNQQTTAFLL